MITKNLSVAALAIIVFILSLGYVHAFSGSGSGTIANPYVITNCTQLAEINDSRTANYSLGNNIDCTDTVNWNSGSGWSPVSPTSGSKFLGTLDGKGYDISGLYINRTTNNIGLFGYADSPANITNFDLVGINIKGGSYVGGVISYNLGARISYMSVQGNISGAADVAGFAGVNDGPISYCYFSGNVTGTGGMIGGVVGDTLSTDSAISMCYSEGTVTGNGVVGGFIARNYGTVSNSYSRTNVTDSSISAGGFAGSTVSGSSISYSYSTGYMDGSNPFYTHGFGEVGGTFTADYWDSQTSGISSTGDYGRGTPKTTTQMKNVSTYTTSSAWDFKNNPNNDAANNDYWDIDPNVNDGYPALVGVGIGEAFLTPTVTLNSPSDNYYFSDDPISLTFNCSVTASNTLSNISLYITDNTNSSFSLNQTTQITGTNNESTWILSLPQGNYTWNCLAYDNTERSDWSSNHSIFGDTIAPTFTTFANQTITYGNALSYDIDATDSGSGVSCFTVNDTSNFWIDCDGVLLNNTVLESQTYWINVTVNDSVNNINSGTMFVNVTPVPSIGLSLVYPTGNINSTQNLWFNITVNVSCLNADCGEINVSLDPISGTGTNYTAYNSSEELGDAFEWIDIIDNGDPIWNGTTVDDSSVLANIPFNFSFYGTNYTTLYISSNGRVHLTSTSASSTAITLPSSTIKVAAPLNKDMFVRSYTKVFIKNATSPTRAIVQYQNLDYFSGGPVNLTYQVIFYHDGRIKFQYNGSSSAYSGTSNIGINFNTSDYLFLDTDAPDTYKGKAITFYPNGYDFSSTKSGLISTTTGTTPFWTNVTNPYNITLNTGESQLVTWWVNATGSIGTNHTFFVYANQTSDMSVGNITSQWNVSIQEAINDTTAPTFSNIANQTVEYGTSLSYDINATDDVSIGCFSVNDTTSFAIDCSGVLTNKTGLSMVLYSINITVNDTSGNANSQDMWVNVTDTISPSLSIVYPSNNTNSSDTGLDINYTASDLNIQACWYSNDTMSTNTTLANCGNITSSIWSQGQHNVTVWANDSIGNTNSSSVTFGIDSISPIWFNNLTNLTSTTTSGESVYFNITFNETNHGYYIFSFYNGTKWVNDSLAAYITATGISVTKNISITSGDINWTWYVNDTLGNTNQTDIWGVSISSSDSDNDGLPDSSDPLLYNETNVTTSGVTQLNITVGGNSTNGTFSGINYVVFYDNSDEIMNFSHNFSQSSLDLSKVSIIKTSTSLVINLSGQLEGNKTVYITDNSFVSLCVKDSEISSVNDISSGCNGANETDFTTCLGGSASINSINCTDQGSTIKVENLQHSGIRGTQATSSSGSGGGGGGSNKKTKNTTNTTKIHECDFDNQCTQDKTCYQNQCVKLFDIKLLEIDSPVSENGTLGFKYFLKGMANISSDVIINFWLENEENVVSSGQDVIYIGSFEEKTEQTMIFIPKNLSAGQYEFYVQVTHENYQARSHRTVYVEPGEKIEVTIIQEPEKEESPYWPLVILFILGLIAEGVYFRNREIRKTLIKILSKGLEKTRKKSHTDSLWEASKRAKTIQILNQASDMEEIEKRKLTRKLLKAFFTGKI